MRYEMFNDISNKLKTFAKIIFWFFTIVAGLMIILALSVSWLYLLIGAVIFFFGYLSSLGVYAFGELLEQIVAIKDNTKKITVIQNKLTNNETATENE